jgi:hypothetical protein
MVVVLELSHLKEPPTILDIVKRITEQRFEKNQNMFMIITGEVGAGKSYAAMRFAETIDSEFSPMKQIVYFPEDFERVFEYVKSNELQTIVFDEAHVTSSSRRWFEFQNIALMQILTVFRQLKKLAVFVVTPLQNLIDKQWRSMFNFYCNVEKKFTERREVVVYGELYSIDVNRYDLRDQNPFLRKIYFRWNGCVWRLGRLVIPLPSKRVIDEYEFFSREFKSKILKSRLERLRDKKEAEKYAEILESIGGRKES